jgi:hypothetical protein
MAPFPRRVATFAIVISSPIPVAFAGLNVAREI